MTEPDPTPAGRFVLTAEQEALLDEPATRRRIIAQVPAAVLFADGAPNDDATLYTHDDPRFTADDVDLILYLIDNPAVLDAIAAEAPDEGGAP